MIQVESRRNSTLLHLSRLGRDKKYRRAAREMVCEGEKMLAEALTSGVKITRVLLRAGEVSDTLRVLLMQAETKGVTVCETPPQLFQLASSVETPQSVIFSCTQPVWDSAILADAKTVLLLDGIQDPGNLGTVLRTADAFALDAVVLCEGCADLFSPKTVRATMGAVFRFPVARLPLEDAAALLQREGLPLYAAAPHGDSLPLGDVDLRRAAVIVGSEGRGVSETALQLVSQCVRIPMAGHAESLNAGVAAAILIYEMTRHRE